MMLPYQDGSLVKMPFGRDALERRFASVVAQIGEGDADYAVFSVPHNIYYLTGVEIGGYFAPHALIVGRNGAHCFVVRNMEMNWREGVGERTWATDWAAYKDDEAPEAAIIAALKRLGFQPGMTLAVELERNWASHSMLQALIDGSGARRILNSSPFVERLRARKDAAEIAHMREAGRLTRLGIEAASAAISSGATDVEAAGCAWTAMLKSGSSWLVASPNVTAGPRSYLAHSRYSHRAPKPGEAVSMLMSSSSFRYQCPSERTFFKDFVPREAEEAMEVLAQAAEAVLSTIKPGMTSHQGDRLVRDIIDQTRFGQMMRHRAAYSIGIGFMPVWWENEIMQLRPNDDRIVEEGMAFHLVTCLGMPEVGMLNRSVSFVVTADGADQLCDLPLRVAPL